MEWIDLLEATTGRFAEVLETGDLAAPVPTCPGAGVSPSGVPSATAPEDAAWTFGPEPVSAFWRRRQVHEVTLHLYDALASQGRTAAWTIDPDLAWDGVDEVATLFYPRQLRLRRTGPLPAPVRIVATDLDRSVVLEADASGDGVELAATATELLLTLWGRLPATGPAAVVLAQATVTP